MRTVQFDQVVEKVAGLCVAASVDLPEDVMHSLESAFAVERSARGRSLLLQCIENARIAARDHVPICQDTGFAVYFVEMGSEVHVEGGLVTDAIREGTTRGYSEGYLRKSLVADPLFARKNTGDNCPPAVHVDLVPGDSIRIVLLPKGGGCENMSALAMLKPADGREGVVRFVVDTVTKAGGNPCPPTIVGVGIGGTADLAMVLAKKALCRKVGSRHSDADYAELESEILAKVNASGVGPQGLGGDTTALAVHIEHHPCHIASLPVAVNLNCHVARMQEIVL